MVVVAIVTWARARVMRGQLIGWGAWRYLQRLAGDEVRDFFDDDPDVPEERDYAPIGAFMFGTELNAA